MLLNSGVLRCHGSFFGLLVHAWGLYRACGPYFVCFAVCLIFSDEHIVTSFGSLNFSIFIQVSIFAGWASFTLSRFVFSFVYACAGIFMAFRFVFCVFCCLNNFLHLLTQS